MNREVRAFRRFSSFKTGIRTDLPAKTRNTIRSTGGRKNTSTSEVERATRQEDEGGRGSSRHIKGIESELSGKKKVTDLHATGEVRGREMTALSVLGGGMGSRKGRGMENMTHP